MHQGHISVLELSPWPFTKGFRFPNDKTLGQGHLKESPSTVQASVLPTAHWRKLYPTAVMWSSQRLHQDMAKSGLQFYFCRFLFPLCHQPPSKVSLQSSERREGMMEPLWWEEVLPTVCLLLALWWFHKQPSSRKPLLNLSEKDLSLKARRQRKIIHTENKLCHESFWLCFSLNT